MNAAYRDILKHSAIYGLGQVLGKLASFLLLPLYTRYLTPADYGCLAVLDLMAAILGILIGSGIAAAVTRYHFEAADQRQRDGVWWTGLSFLCASASTAVAGAWLARAPLARILLGEHPQGTYYVCLMLATVWVSAVVQLPNTSLRVDKRSGTVVGVSLAGLLLNIGLNVALLTVWHMGVAGVLWGNLLSNTATAAVLTALFVRGRGPYLFDWYTLARLWRFGSPLVLTGLLATLMQQADRYLLRVFLDMEQVGIYSLAMAFAAGLNTLILLPFGTIWNVVMYEMARLPNARQHYAAVYRYATEMLALALFGLALMAKPLVSLIASKPYYPAAELIPVVCLGYCVYSMHEHFKVPALLAKKTVNLIPSYAVATLVNIGANIVLIHMLGVMGAAWASVLTFAAFSLTGLMVNRRIERYPYPFGRIAVVLAGMVACYLALCAVCAGRISQFQWALLAMVVWLAWAGALFGFWVCWIGRRWLSRSQTRPALLDCENIDNHSTGIVVPEGLDDPVSSNR